MTNVLSVINGLFTTAIRSLYPGHVHSLKGVVQFSGSGSRFGDYKCVAAMPISKVCTHLTSTKINCRIFHEIFKYFFMAVIEEPRSEHCSQRCGYSDFL